MGRPERVGKDLTNADIEAQWEMVEFGRAPQPDYSIPIPHRRRMNIQRAEEILVDMIKNRGIRPDTTTLNAMVSVYADGMCEGEARATLSQYDDMGCAPNASTYLPLLRLSIKRSEISTMETTLAEMRSKGIRPDAESFGLVIQTYTNRGMVVEALKALEEAAAGGVRVREPYLKRLRGRLNNLGMSHPNMPADPMQWVRDVKTERRKAKQSSQSKINDVKTALYVR